MSDLVPNGDARHSERLKLPAMYTLIRVRPVGETRYLWSGFIYDVSRTGMRFELDAPVLPGSKLEVKALLPGPDQITFRATGTVVRIHDDDETPGPTRMGLLFDSFTNDTDEKKLSGYLKRNALRAA